MRAISEKADFSETPFCQSSLGAGGGWSHGVGRVHGRKRGCFGRSVQAAPCFIYRRVLGIAAFVGGFEIGDGRPLAPMKPNASAKRQ
jgi:hypothetical protein